ncbi:MAG: hypothetical protein NTY09_09295, partial [bacterium]|nr:hypothetical protein [bacterium]
DFTSIVSGGTYIRSLGRDIANELGTLGYLIGLERTASGPFKKEVAIPFSAFEIGGSNVLLHHLRPVDEILENLDAIIVRNDSIEKIKDGRVLLSDDFIGGLPLPGELEDVFKIVDDTGEFLSLGRSKGKLGGITPFKPWISD